MKVPFLDNRRLVERTLPALSDELDAMLCQDTWVNGAQVRCFEKAICDYTGARFAIATGNASDSLILALKALDIGPGDEVIVPCYSFFASLSSILHVGATPVFVDIEPYSYSLNVSAVEEKITPRTRALMPVHLFRQMADMQALCEIANRHHLAILEDSAEGIGMREAGIHAGLHGDIGVLSFFPTKTLGALGDAGMIITNHPELAERARRLADNGRDAQGLAQLRGMNSRMDDLQALCLRLRLEILDEDIKRRAQRAAQYEHLLKPLSPTVEAPRIVFRLRKQEVVDYVYLIECDDRDGLAAWLDRNGIDNQTYYPLPLHLQPVCRDFGYRAGDFPHAESSAKRALGLPMFADLSEAAIDHICRTIADFYNQQER